MTEYVVEKLQLSFYESGPGLQTKEVLDSVFVVLPNGLHVYVGPGNRVGVFRPDGSTVATLEDLRP